MIRSFFRALALPAALTLAFVAGFATIQGFSQVAYAAASTDVPGGAPPASWIDLAKPILDAALAHNYVAAFALALVLAVAAAKRLTGSSRLAVFVHGDVGGAVTTFALAFFGAIATAVPTGGIGALSWELVRSTGLIAFAAAGGYSLAKKLLVPVLQRFAAGHAWAQPIVGVVLWAFDKSSAVQAIEAKATQTGAAAVAASPSPGAAAVVGQPEQF